MAREYSGLNVYRRWEHDLWRRAWPSCWLDHVDVVDRCRGRAVLYLQAGAQPVEAVRAAGGQIPERRQAQGGDRPRDVQAVSLQPPREGRPLGAPGISVSAGERRWSEPRGRPGYGPPLDSARDSADAVGLEEGRQHARNHRHHGPVRRTAGDGRRRHQRVHRHRGHGFGRHRRRLGRYRRSARRNGAGAVRRHPGGVVLQLPHRAPRVLQRRNGQLDVGIGGLLHQEDCVSG